MTVQRRGVGGAATGDAGLSGSGTEPLPPDPSWPRYSELPFPPYRFVPGVTPHPHRDPRGYAFGKGPETQPPWSPENWRTLTPYLYGIDLYNHAYWWECHETLEGLWHAVGRKGTPGDFLQGIIHVAAANLNRHRGKLAGAARQARKGLARLDRVEAARQIYMGVDVDVFTRAVRESFASGATGRPPFIRLTDAESR